MIYKGDVTSDDGKKHLAAVGYYILLQIRARLVASNCDVPDGWRPVVTAVPERLYQYAVWLFDATWLDVIMLSDTRASTDLSETSRRFVPLFIVREHAL